MKPANLQLDPYTDGRVIRPEEFRWYVATERV